MAAHYPAEIFGFPVENRNAVAESVRQEHRCPFINGVCNKQSRLISYHIHTLTNHATD